MIAGRLAGAPAPAAAPFVASSRLIVNADDLGETSEITRGILECIDAGVVTSTTVLANMPATPLALREAAARGRRVSFGVHLNLCEGPALTRAPSLAPRGLFLPKRVQALRALTRRLDLKELEAELRAQIARVLEAGVQVSHLDSHKHLHQLPGVSEVAIGLAREFGIGRVRCTLEAGPIRGRAAAARASAWARRQLARRLQARLAESSLRHAARTFDIADLMRLSEQKRVDLLRGRAPWGPAQAVHRGNREPVSAPGRPADPVADEIGGPGVYTAEMVCHPGTQAADVEKPGSCRRFAEYEFLRSERFRALLDRAGVTLASFWEI